MLWPGLTMLGVSRPKAQTIVNEKRSGLPALLVDNPL